MDQSSVPDDATLDRLLDGRLQLYQPAKGYRAGVDAALLAAACDAAQGQRVLEAGCGAGAVMLAIAARTPVSVAGLERDPAMAALARDNARLNGLEARATVIDGDVAGGFAALALPAFDAVVANPPFFDDPGAIRGPHPARRGAYLADDGLGAWIGFMLKAARGGGTLTLIHRADRLADILGLLAAKAGSVRVRPIHPFADQPAKRVLVRAVKTGKAPLVLLPPLVLHDRSEAKHTPEAETILRGEAALGWD